MMAVGELVSTILHPVSGIRLGTTSAGIKVDNRPDLVVIELCAEATTAGVFTQNAFCAAPIQIAKNHLKTESPSHFIVNTGNANAGTGEQGIKDCRDICNTLAQHIDTAVETVLPFSTGVIGELLPVGKITDAIPSALEALSDNGWSAAAEGIMTTDTRPKSASTQFEFAGHTITVTGIAKGAGMIKPNMATMLAYIATDAPVHETSLNSLLNVAVNQSFNRITVDGDTSTNDACMLVATGRVPVDTVTDNNSSLYSLLQDAITSVCIDLAQGLIRDGEGAGKFVTVMVNGGLTEQECLQVAYTVAESPLVKTALFASDPNWGRLLAAIGRSGVDDLDVSKVSIKINDILIAEQGGRAASYTETQGAVVMKSEEISIVIDLARGGQTTTVWTTDLSYDYVRINAEYRS